MDCITCCRSTWIWAATGLQTLTVACTALVQGRQWLRSTSQPRRRRQTVQLCTRPPASAVATPSTASTRPCQRRAQPVPTAILMTTTTIVMTSSSSSSHMSDDVLPFELLPTSTAQCCCCCSLYVTSTNSIVFSLLVVCDEDKLKISTKQLKIMIVRRQFSTPV